MPRVLSIVSITVVLNAVLLVGSIRCEEPDPRIAAALAKTTEAATHYEFQLGGEHSQRLEFHHESLLRWSNPVIGVIYGNVFVWTHEGRPEVIGSMLQWYSPHKHATHEFHSLSTGPIEGLHDGKTVWRTNAPGFQLVPIPNRPAVDASPLVRQRYMRSIARQLKITSTNQNGVTDDLRLLPQPLFRYGDAKSNVIDGALFSFVQGTDPEVILLIEARKGDSGTAEWQFAMTRMAAIKFVAEFKGNEVWRAERIPYAKAMRGREPYALFRFQPTNTEGQ